jgi:hypothetical protein
MRTPFWSVRPTAHGALVTTAWVALAGTGLAWVATALSPFSARSNLDLASGAIDEVYLTQLPEDPARALLTTQRSNSTWARDQASQAGDPYWVRRYDDPAHPGLPKRILLTSRSRGAHLLVPLGALDLEHALSEPLEERADGAPEPPAVRSRLTQVFWNRAFAGVFLHLRFPEREPPPNATKRDERRDFDLVIVRGNELLTTDFLLQPNGELYRAALARGQAPAGPLRRNPLTGDELVLLVYPEKDAASVPLYSPVSLFDELRLCWGAQIGTILDDRWRLERAPAFVVRPPSEQERASAVRNGALHLAARIEGHAERRSLELALARFAGS